VICFFDPAHGQASVNVMWQPQWGVARPVEVCQFCAQRIQTTQPPYYQPVQQQGYPQQGYPQAGYPQQGYPAQQPGYPQQGQYQQPPRQGHSTGAVIGAGAAGLVGGMLLGEMLEGEENKRGEEQAYERGFEERGYDDQRNVNSFNVESAPLPTMVTQKVDRGLQLFEFLVDEGVLDVDLVLLSRGVPLRGLLIQPVIRRVDQQAVLA